MTDTATAALSGDNSGGAPGAAATAAAPAGAAPTGGQGASPAWYGDADESTSAYVTNKGWQSPTDLLNSYRNLEKFAGGSKNLVELPGVDADEGKLGEFYNRLGRPADPNGYEIKAPEGGDPEMTEWFKSTAHKLGLTSKQATELFGQYNQWATEKMTGVQQASQQQAAQAAERDINSLKQEWGQGYDAQIDMGRRAVAALGMDQAKLSEYEAKLGTGEMLKMFATLGSKLGEPSFADGGRSGGASGFGLTPAQAQQQIADLRTDKGFMDQYMSGNKEAVAKMQRLMGAAYAS